MSGLPAAVLPRVASLVRLLGSPMDGEALGAARALARTLAGAGSDFHGVADIVERQATPAAEPKRSASRKARKAARPRPTEPPPSRPPPPPPRQPHRPDLVELSPDDRAAIVAGLSEAVEDADGRLSDWQRTFARDLLDTVGRRRLCPTARQMQFVRDILATVRGSA